MTYIIGLKQKWWTKSLKLANLYSKMSSNDQEGSILHMSSKKRGFEYNLFIFWKVVSRR